MSKSRSLAALVDEVVVFANDPAYGADRLGIVDSTVAINNAIAACLALGGGKVRLQGGNYLLSGSGLIINQSAITSGFASNSRVCIEGDGDGNTSLTYTQTTGTNYAFTFTGNLTAATYGWYTRFSMENLHLVGPGLAYTNNGILLQQGGTVSFRNVTVSGFNTGLQGYDLIGCLFENSNFMFNNQGFDFVQSAGVPPNAITFSQCAIMYNANYGGLIQGATGCAFYGGYVQNNGNTGAASAKFGLKIDNSAYGGQGVNARIDAVWFESNGDGTANSTADLHILNGYLGGSAIDSVTVIGCPFERSEPHTGDGLNYYCTNNLRWDFNGSNKSSLTLLGSSFASFNQYVSNSARPYLNLNVGSNTNYEFYEFGNEYANPINSGTSEKPTFTNVLGTAPTIVGRTLNKQGMASAWGNFLGSGGGISINQGYNISSVSRNSAGNYTINFRTPVGNNYCPTIITAFAGYGYVSGAGSTTSITVQVVNTSGVATDGTFALALFGGDAVA